MRAKSRRTASLYGIYAVAKRGARLRPLSVPASPSSRPVRRSVPRSNSFDPVVAKACGKVLRALRQERAIAQDAFALLAGIDRSYYGKLERGERQPSLSIVFRCGKALGLPSATLVAAVEFELSRPR